MDKLTGLTPFQFEGRNVRLIDQDGETWFVATDVARELGYRDAADLVRTLDPDEKGTHSLRTPSGDQEMSIISEPGLYRAIVQRRTNKKHDASLTAKIERFQRWVFHDILPSIRKTGGYGQGPVLNVRDPRQIAQVALQLIEVVKEKDERIAELEPQAAALDRIATADGSLCITDAAKALQCRPKDLFAYLRAHGWIYRRPGTSHDLGYQSKVQAGLLEHKVVTITNADGSERIHEQVRVTPKGLTILAKVFKPAVSAA